MPKAFDVVLWGCTGFTGRLVAQYFAKRIAHRVPTLRWALAGRSEAKLQEVAASIGCGADDERAVPLLVATNDTIERVAQDASVILSTAGPFALHGSPVVEACIRAGCDYVDINGEPGWHRSMIDRYDTEARSKGVILVPSSGFDSIPSDLGVQWMAERIAQQSGLPTRRITCYVALRGAFSGGTVASGINGDEEWGPEYLANPFLLGGERSGDAVALSEHDDRTRPAWDEAIRSYVAPFGMAPINTRVVRRSVALLEESKSSLAAQLYSPDFCYQEVAIAPSEEAATKMTRAAFAPASKRKELVSQGRLPSPGEGPDADTRAKSWFKMMFVADSEQSSTGDILRLAGSVSGGDPGYDETSKMVSETAVALVSDKSKVGGFLTPATALGAPLRMRLHSEGIRFEEEPLPSHTSRL